MLFHIIQVIQPLFSTNLPTTLSVSNLYISVIKYVFLQYVSYTHYKGREHGDLAANISPTNENPFTDVPLKIYLVLK